MKLCALIAAMSLAAVPLQFGAAQAADHSMEMSSMDCATANATMMKMTSQEMKPALHGSASLDKNFAIQMHAMMEHDMQMAKLEAKCGKDAKTRATAVKMTEDLQDYAARLSIPPAY